MLSTEQLSNLKTKILQIINAYQDSTNGYLRKDQPIYTDITDLDQDENGDIHFVLDYDSVTPIKITIPETQDTNLIAKSIIDSIKTTNLADYVGDEAVQKELNANNTFDKNFVISEYYETLKTSYRQNMLLAYYMAQRLAKKNFHLDSDPSDELLDQLLRQLFSKWCLEKWIHFSNCHFLEYPERACLSYNTIQAFHLHLLMNNYDLDLDTKTLQTKIMHSFGVE